MNNKKIILNPIGVAKVDEKSMQYSILIDKEFRDGLKELNEYSHISVFWWAHKNDNDEARSNMIADDLPFFYGKEAPSMGVFATRSEFRPNPILYSTIQILSMDKKQGIIKVNYLDALDGSPIIDIKPYILMSDKHESAKYPKYLNHWPKCNEDAMAWWEKIMSDYNE